MHIPILMFHGDADPQVDIEQSRAMAAALKRAGKPYQFIEFKRATHQIASSADRATMMHTIEDFLITNMGAPAGPVTSSGVPAASSAH